jgi:Galactose oxidase, central domain
VLGALLVLAAVAACGPQTPLVDHSGVAGVPGPRTDASSAYDPANGTIVMFGGADRSGVLDETWTWDGATWRRLHPTHSPPARELSLMAFEPSSRHVLLFGGLTCPAPWPNDFIGCDYVASATHLSDTWSWDGKDWSPVPTAHSPDVPYFGPQMVGAGTDTANGRLMLLTFVKVVTGHEGLATWAFENGDWRQLHPKHSPLDLEFGGPAFDSASGRFLVQQSSGPHVDCGTAGPCAQRPLYNMTWAWDGSDWQDLGPQVGTPHDYGDLVSGGSSGLLLVESGAMQLWSGKKWGGQKALAWSDNLRTGWIAAFDQASNQLVLFGGRSWGTNHLYGDTLAWSGSAWATAVPAVPSPSLTLSACSASAAESGPGWQMAQDVPDSAVFELGFVEPRDGPCRLDVVVHFSLAGPDGKLLPIQGNPAQVEVRAVLTFDVGTEFATFTLTHACGLPAGATATFEANDYTTRDSATVGYCQSTTPPMTLTPGTLNRPAAK